MKKRWWRSMAVGAALLVGGVVLSPWEGAAQEELRIQGDAVAVYNLAGTVEIVPGSGREVVVQLVRGGRDADQLEMDVGEVDGREALLVRYPGDRVVYPEMGRGSRTQIRVRDDGAFFLDDWGRARQVTISGSGRGLEAWADLRIAVPQGQEFALFLAVGETELQGVNGDVLVDTGSGAVQAFDSRGELFVDTGSGNVLVEGFQGGDLELDTGSGEIEIRNVQGRDVMVDTGSGEVVAGGVTAERVEIDTGSGRIQMSGLSSPRVTLDTGSGEVDVELLGDVDEMEIDTGSGSVTIRAPSSLGAEVEMDTGSGGIDLDFPMEVREVERDHLRGILGDGRGRIQVDTGSGLIRLIGRG